MEGRMQKFGIRKEESLDDVLITVQLSILKMAVEILINGNFLTAHELVYDEAFKYKACKATAPKKWSCCYLNNISIVPP